MIRLEGGARTGAIVAAGAAALGLGLLLPPGWAAAPVALYAAALAFAAGRTAGRAEAAARRAVAALESQSARLGPALQGLLERLLRLEERLPDGPEAPADPALAEVGRELGELSELVRDLAVTLAAQGRELVALREAEPARSEPPPAAPAPKPTPPPARDPRPAEDAVADAVRADAVELHLQPIVGLPQRKVRLYDAQPRLRIGDATLAAAEFGPVVERLGIAAALDRKTLARAAAAARHLAARGSDALVALSLSPVAGLGPGGLRALAEIADPTAAERLVLFVSQGCWRGLDPEAAAALAFLRERGFGLGLDRAADLRLDPPLLAERGVRFARLPAVRPAELPAALARAGIRIVAERVDREEEVPDLLDLDVPLAQGLAFGGPRPVRPEILAAPAPEPAPAPVPEASAEPARQPFRSFLRRAV